MQLVELTVIKTDGKVRKAFPPDKIVVEEGSQDHCWIRVISSDLRGEFGPCIKIESSFDTIVARVNHALKDIEIKNWTGGPK